MKFVTVKDFRTPPSIWEKLPTEREMVITSIDYFKRSGEFINAEHLAARFSDETDKKFYEVYKSGKAHYLVTGNIKHFPREDTILIPKGFMEILDT